MHSKLKFKKDSYENVPFKRHNERMPWKLKNSWTRQNTHLILVNSSTSSLLQPCVQPENASMSISYLRWSTRNGPFCLRSLITLLPKSSIWEVNLRALKLTLHRSLWISKGCSLLASRASVRFKWTTLYFCIKGRIWNNNHTICFFNQRNRNSK